MVIAVSGKCCSGKNYISSILEKDGFELVDVDEISRDIFNRSEKEIINLFGDQIVENGHIDRLQIGKIIFSDRVKREKLESIIHPAVYKEIFNRIANSGKEIVINIPLLTDNNLIEKCDAVIWISSPLFLRVIRALKRDSYSIKTVIKRIFTQRKLSVKHLKNRVDIYNIKNSWSRRRFVKSYSSLLDKLLRG